MNVSIAGWSLCFRPCFLLVRVLLYPTLTPFICLPCVSTFFCFSPLLLPTCCSYLSRCILCVFHSARVSQVVSVPFFLLFSVLYFADKASKLISFLSPLFCLLIFLRISWGCLFTERSSLNPFCLYFFFLQTQILTTSDSYPPSLSIVLCSRSIALLLIDPDV